MCRHCAHPPVTLSQSFLLMEAVLGRPSLSACPPSCATNDLLVLLDTYCSDKGTFWQIGIGEDTAPSVAAWANYFPNADIFPVDIKTKKEVAERARPDGATDRLVKHQARFGCEYNYSMWSNPRVHLTLETDASVPEQLRRVQLPNKLDIIIDDGSHKYLDQETTLHTLWPMLRDGGFYVIEDMLVGALPWDAEHAKQVPTTNSNCGSECFFPQRIAEHPFMFDRFGHQKGASAPMDKLTSRSKELLRRNDWFWVVTGVHQADPRELQTTQHQLELALKQQGELQKLQAQISGKLQSVHAEAAILAKKRQDRIEATRATPRWSETILHLALLASVCLNFFLLTRQRKITR
ncbi:MAG: hypothetical protein SGPRY_001070 [Prymnesium sp.]